MAAVGRATLGLTMYFACKSLPALFWSIALLLLFLNGMTIVVAEPIPSPSAAASPIVDLRYATYQGYYDTNYSLNVFKG